MTAGSSPGIVGEICCSMDPQCRRPAGRTAVAPEVPGWQTLALRVFEFPISPCHWQGQATALAGHPHAQVTPGAGVS